MAKAIQILLISLICLIYPLKSFAGGVEKHIFRVSVNVSTNNKLIKSSIESYIDRQLRQLGDVVVTDSKPDYILRVTELDSKLRNGRVTGYVLNMDVLGVFYNTYLKSLVPKKYRNAVNISTSGLYYFYGNDLMIANTDYLQNTCNSLVADFDSNELESERKFWQKMQDYSKKNSNKK